MTKRAAIALLAGLMVGGVVLSGSTNTTASPYERGDRYIVSAAGDGAWRVDTLTGRMVWCHAAVDAKKGDGPTILRGSGGRRVVCYDRDGKINRRLF